MKRRLTLSVVVFLGCTSGEAARVAGHRVRLVAQR
jgi:hypothetical protein